MLGCNVRYTVKISYKEGVSSSQDITYNILASNKEASIKIARSIFYSEFDNRFNDSVYLIESKLDKPTLEEIVCVNDKLSSVYGFIKESFVTMNYKKFLKAYLSFAGSDIMFIGDSVSYLVKFGGFTFRVKYKDGVCFVEEDEILYHSVENNRYYVIRDDCTTILIGS